MRSNSSSSVSTAGRSRSWSLSSMVSGLSLAIGLLPCRGKDDCGSRPPRVRRGPELPHLVLVGDRQLLRRVQGDHLGALGGHHHLLLDPRGRVPVRRRAVGLQREDHALADLHRMLHRVQPADDRPLVQAEAEPVAELEPEGDRKSTRLNSSHITISYAVFCLKKKKQQSFSRFYANLQQKN